VALQTLFFGISADASGRSLLEEYIFNFDFSDGGARLDLTTDGKSFSSSKAAAGQVTTSVSSVMRTLYRVSIECCTAWTFYDHGLSARVVPVSPVTPVHRCCATLGAEMITTLCN